MVSCQVVAVSIHRRYNLVSRNAGRDIPVGTENDVLDIAAKGDGWVQILAHEHIRAPEKAVSVINMKLEFRNIDCRIPTIAPQRKPSASLHINQNLFVMI